MLQLKKPLVATGQAGIPRTPEGCADDPTNTKVCGSCGSSTKPPPTREMRSKEEVLSYRFPALVGRIARDLKISNEQASVLFHDMLKFLFLCGTQSKLGPFSPPPRIDKAWHTFILFTKEYARFCDENFGHFVHHVPFTDETSVSHRCDDNDITVGLARKTFGKLSGYWVRNSPEDCSQCAPDKDCNGGGEE